MTKVKDLVEKYGNREIDEVELEKILKPEKVKTIYDLEKGDKYYHIAERDTCDWVVWDNDTIDNQRLAIGNVFLTQEDCEFAIEYLKVRAELKRYASMCETEVDWHNSNQGRHYLHYDYTNREISIRRNIVWIHDEIYFTDENILKQAIKEIGKERIIKYYFGVEGENK